MLSSSEISSDQSDFDFGSDCTSPGLPSLDFLDDADLGSVLLDLDKCSYITDLKQFNGSNTVLGFDGSHKADNVVFEDSKSYNDIKFTNNHTNVEEFVNSDKKSLSKNAINARENRRKKKEYVNHLENNVNKLVHDNNLLKESLNRMCGKIHNLNNEVMYLKSVLANQSELAGILHNVLSIPGLKSVCSQDSVTPTIVDRTLSTLSSGTQTYKSEIVGKSTISEKGVNSKKRKCKLSQSSTLGLTKFKKTNDLTSKTPIDSCNNNDHMYARSDSEDDVAKTVNGGVCIHVTNGNVSLEFCSVCNDQLRKKISV